MLSLTTTSTASPSGLFNSVVCLTGFNKQHITAWVKYIHEQTTNSNRNLSVKEQLKCQFLKMNVSSELLSTNGDNKKRWEICPGVTGLP